MSGLVVPHKSAIFQAGGRHILCRWREPPDWEPKQSSHEQWAAKPPIARAKELWVSVVRGLKPPELDLSTLRAWESALNRLVSYNEMSGLASGWGESVKPSARSR
jgi:hypothetical protein